MLFVHTRWKGERIFFHPKNKPQHLPGNTVLSVSMVSTVIMSWFMVLDSGDRKWCVIIDLGSVVVLDLLYLLVLFYYFISLQCACCVLIQRKHLRSKIPGLLTIVLSSFLNTIRLLLEPWCLINPHWLRKTILIPFPFYSLSI